MAAITAMTTPMGTSSSVVATKSGRLAALATLTRRRLELSLRTPRAILLPLATPILIAVVIAPALAHATGHVAGIDYLTYLAVGTAALVASGLQLVALVGCSVARGASLHTSPAGLAWFAGAGFLLAVATYGIAETLANRIGEEEEYVNAIPTIGIAPWFFAGSLFPISFLPAGLAAIAKLLPVTHAVALMRYGLVDHHAADLHAIWGLTNPTLMAALSTAVLVAYAALLLSLAIRTFTRRALR